MKVTPHSIGPCRKITQGEIAWRPAKPLGPLGGPVPNGAWEWKVEMHEAVLKISEHRFLKRSFGRYSGWECQERYEGCHAMPRIRVEGHFIASGAE